MNLPQDPMMMLSVVNTNLRDRYETFDDFCRTEDVDKEYVTRSLARIEYEYDEKANQFK